MAHNKTNNLYNYLLTLVISTYNRPDETLRFIKSVVSNILFETQVIIINDNSSVSYEGVKCFVANYKNIEYVDNKISIHKFWNFMNNRNLYKGKYIGFLDDKDIMSDNWGANIFSALKKEGRVIVSDMLNRKNEIIGQKFSGKTLGEFHFLKAGYGDKLNIFSTDIFLAFNPSLHEFVNTKIYNLNIFMDEIFDLPIEYVKQPLVIHEYLSDGITQNNIINKQKNWAWTAKIIRLRMKHKACFKYKVYKCYEVWLIRKKTRFVFENKQYERLYKTLFCTGSFYFINCLFKLKLKSLVK